MKEKKSPCQRGPTRGRDGLFSQVGYAVRLFLFSLAAGDDDRGSAQDEHDASHVEDRGTNAAGGGKRRETKQSCSLLFFGFNFSFQPVYTVLLQFLPIG